MDSCDKKFREIDDLKLKIRSSKQDAKAYLSSNNLTSQEISKQIKKTTQRVKMYRAMKNLQKEKTNLPNKVQGIYQQKQYELTFKVLNRKKMTQKHTYFIERNLDEVLISFDAFDQLV